jgi:hypothetical protein
MRFRRRRAALSYEVPPPLIPGEQLSEAMFRLSTALYGRPRLSLGEWERRCEASLVASRARRAAKR